VSERDFFHETLQTIVVPVLTRHAVTGASMLGMATDQTETQIAGTLGLLISLGFAIRSKVKERRARKLAASNAAAELAASRSK
jgi:hypothetical protein